jgi:membrane-associated phospholipid phosphatase
MSQQNLSTKIITHLISYLLVVILSLDDVYAQRVAADPVGDSLGHTGAKSNWKKVALTPAILISVGLFTATKNNLFDKYDGQKVRNDNFPQFRTHVDDYLIYAPIVAVYSLNALGIKGEHDLANQTALLIKSELFMAAMVFPIKELTAVARPDTGELNSFPSGHTAQAFAAATFLHKEYGKEHPWCSMAAFGTATSVGFFRMLNNRHWVSDVLVGAGIGMLATNLAYLTHQNKWGKKKKKEGVVWIPSYQRETFLLSLVIPVR